jgi:hypothetical protein
MLETEHLGYIPLTVQQAAELAVALGDIVKEATATA